jgi:hypothetical protein
MGAVANPILQQVLHRRRMLRLARWSAAAWVFFGGLHVIAWWAGFDHRFAAVSQDRLQAVVWPLLFAATVSFVSLVVFTVRWFLTPDEVTSDSPAPSKVTA